MADWLLYLQRFDHRMDDITLPIKDQGIIKSPVRIGPDTWIGVKVERAARHATIGRGCVYARSGPRSRNSRLFGRGRGAGQGGQNASCPWEASAHAQLFRPCRPASA